MMMTEPPFPGTVVHMDRPCSWLDVKTKRCSRYDERPQVCRSFPVGCEECLGWRAEY